MEDHPAEMNDGFILRKPKIDLPLSNGALDPGLQRDLLICHLFANNRYPIADIAHRFSLDAGNIIEILLSQQVVWDRRRRPTLAA